MGRSTASCFKIITCGRDSVDRDDLQASENTASTDKRGWSFRKRSARHRVLNNTVNSEAPSSVYKECLESADADFQSHDKSAIPEKSSGMQWTDETPKLSTSVNSKFSEVIAVAEVDTKFEVKPDESVVTVIQAAIRRFLAERELLKQKKIVKLQAVVRGHLVRRHAVGSLRCVQAIIKMQALVRARRARLSAKGSIVEEKLDEKLGKDNHTTKLQDKKRSGTNPDLAYASIEKLLSNRFARQLLESSPRTKSINIKCDPSRSDSAWKWLERWVSVSPSGIERSQKSDSSIELQEQENVKHPENQVKTLIPAGEDYESTDLRSSSTVATVQCLKSDAGEATMPCLKFDAEETAVPSESEETLVCQKVEQPQPEILDLSKSNSDRLLNQNRQSNLVPQMELNSLYSKPELETVLPKSSMKRVASEQPETEDRKFVFGSRKASNAAFIAAQSKFEELTYTTNSAKSISVSNQEIEAESCANTVSSIIDNTIRTREINLAENSVSPTSRVLVGGSECGTELSISSTLDSPDQSEVGAVEFEQEANISEEGAGDPKHTTYIDVEAKVDSTISVTDLSYPQIVQSDKHDNNNGAFDEQLKSAIGADSSKVEQKLEENSSDMQIESHETVHQVYKSSPEASPRSHINVQENQGTPSRQISTKAKKTKSEKNGSNQKRKSLSAGKRSPIKSNNDSGVRSSLEQLPKDLKTGKRRNSFGSGRSDHSDQEARDSGSGHSLPSYMQATESARAKAYANSSPRSSLDVQDKEIYIKKRHSLPGANGRQGSPRIQRSMSQAQQSAKGNGTNASHERKWQR